MKESIFVAFGIVLITMGSLHYLKIGMSPEVAILIVGGFLVMK